MTISSDISSTLVCAASCLVRKAEPAVDLVTDDSFATGYTRLIPAWLPIQVRRSADLGKLPHAPVFRVFLPSLNLPSGCIEQCH